MNIHWVGVLPFALFVLQCAFTVTGIILLHKAMSIIALSFFKSTNTHIFMPMFFLVSYSLICILFKQAISFKFITFTYEDTELFINLVLGLIHIIVALGLLLKILNNIKIDGMKV